MKIGIITLFYKNNNYGAVLQALALCRTVTTFGHMAEVIRFDRMDSFSFWGQRKSSFIRKITRFIVLRANDLAFCYRKVAFAHFSRKNIPYSRQVYDWKSISLCDIEYDLFIAGSDQVWSPISGCDMTFLGFVKGKGRKKSYAASIGEDKVTEEYRRYLIEKVADFSAISVREKTAAMILAPELNAVTVLDPVFLPEKEFWESFTDKKETSDSYLFSYYLGDNYENRKASMLLARRVRCINRLLPFGKCHFNRIELKYLFGGMNHLSPAGFLTAINNAEYVLTDSFHCAAFCIIFRKQFLVLDREDRNRKQSMSSRLRDLLELFGLSNRIVSNAITKSENAPTQLEELLKKPIDWEKVEKVLLLERKRSLEFLSESLSSK